MVNQDKGKGGPGEQRPPFKSMAPSAPKRSVKWLHRTLFVLVTSLCLAFSGADTELDFGLVTNEYSEYLKDLSSI